MGGEPHTGGLKLGGNGAGVGLASLDPIGNQDHGRRVFGVAEGAGGLNDRGSHRRSTAWVDRVDRRGNRVAGVEPGFDQRLDIGTIAAGSVAIDGQAQSLRTGQVLQHLANHFTGDDDLIHPVDLAPHGARGIQHQDRGWRFIDLGLGGHNRPD